MRKLVLMLFPLSVALTACGPAANSDKAAGHAAATQAAISNEVHGTVSLQPGVIGDTDVAPSARLEISLVDISQRPSLPLAHKTIEPVGALPASFSVSFDHTKVAAGDVIVVVAELIDGDRHYTMPLQQALLPGMTSVDLKLVPQPTRSEQELANFKDLEKQLGGMKMTDGTSRGDHGSRAWQIFKKNGHVQFVRTIVDDFDSGSRVKSSYAYKDGKPWVVVRQHLAKADANPSSVERVSWDANGKPVLRQRVAGGQIEELALDSASDLFNDAGSEYRKAGSK